MFDVTRMKTAPKELYLDVDKKSELDKIESDSIYEGNEIPSSEELINYTKKFNSCKNCSIF